jgi:hypothetical protein
MAYMQKPGRAPLKNKNFEALTNGTPLRNEDKEKKDPRFKYDKDGNQIGMQDTATGSYYTPTEKGFEASKAKAEKIGVAPRPYKGRLTEFGDKDRAAGFVNQKGEFKRANNPRELESLRKQYAKEKRYYDADEKRRSTRRGTILDYTGPKRKK